MRIFAISDIHACYRTFEALLQKIDLNKEDELYLLGDYIDRGPSSKEVIELILKLQKENYNVHCLLGNHEVMMLHALRYPHSPEAQSWQHWNGGDSTLKSFGVTFVSDIDEKYIRFMLSLSYYLEKDHFLFVHAGLNFKLADPLGDKESMLWSFDDRPKVNKKWLGDRIIVHGHRIHTRSRIRQNISELDTFPVLGIDNGCVYPKREYNKLCAVELNNMELYFQKNIEIH
ncbi:serine/threonine protein phosphatase 1 [Catalinimonas alkaloidigena]|uniref:metallophosphoesterase family protein n=1 Tax=Catalinimonas alkaloidigena TaxID=1075417 RepID=UPI0024067519|nr:metallophosphoesterase family protein [Catalinimonas alkaloidigena]MDF9795712.1 serine/threonine protein phosphatase 1 [Catalinimonas alkaloidigena]